MIIVLNYGITNHGITKVANFARFQEWDDGMIIGIIIGNVRNGMKRS